MAFDQQQAIKDYEHFMRLISVGAYEERSYEHRLTDTWPEDGVEESVFNLEELAARSDLEFCWHKDSSSWSLETMSEATKAARKEAQEYQDTQHHMEHHYEGGE